MSQIATKTYEPTPARKVAFLGLGVMGYPMAGHLARAGHHVTIYNRTAAKAKQWVGEYGGRAAATRDRQPLPHPPQLPPLPPAPPAPPLPHRCRPRRCSRRRRRQRR